jgi:hypothetical protein
MAWLTKAERFRGLNASNFDLVDWGSEIDKMAAGFGERLRPISQPNSWMLIKSICQNMKIRSVWGCGVSYWFGLAAVWGYSYFFYIYFFPFLHKITCI